MPTKQPMHIMTSSDNNLVLYILPQLAAIGVNLQQYDVHFYLFHSRIEAAHVETLRVYAETFEHITFHEIKITDTAPYEQIAEGGGNFWPPETYFSLCCHHYLPSDVERVLYIDAGDIIIDGDITEYYFTDFEGCSLIANNIYRFTTDNDGAYTDMLSGVTDPKKLAKILENIKSGAMDLTANKIKVRPYRQDDMADPEKLRVMLSSGIMTSGCYVINVRQFRADERAMGDYLYLYQTLRGIFPNKKMIYLGDQAFLSVAFAGDIKYFGFPEKADPWYMPYEFGVWYFNKKSVLDYTPIVLHYAGPTIIKPWQARFSVEEVKKYNFATEPRQIHAPCYLTPQYVELFEIWWAYCKMTPAYDEMNRDARAAAAALEKHYLPLCKWYNELADDYLKATGKEPPELLQNLLFKDE